MSSINISPDNDKSSQIERVDELDKYYKPIETLDNGLSKLYLFSAILSIVVLYKNQIPWQQLQILPELVFALSVIIHVILSAYLRLSLFPIAERKRRQQLLSDSFGIPLTIEKTQNYYNNGIPPSLARLGANVLENTLFAKTIASRMLDKERIKIFIYFLVYILLCRGADWSMLIIVTQTLFSSEILGKWLRLELLRWENEKYYQELYYDFLHKVDFTNLSVTASTLDKFAAYEVAKGMTGIRLSKSIFSSLNPILSIEWNDIRKKLGIDQLNHRPNREE